MTNKRSVNSTTNKLKKLLKYVHNIQGHMRYFTHYINLLTSDIRLR